MCSLQDTFTLICKPEQSGKTFIMIQELIKDLTEDGDELDGKIVINFIFCDNNLLLTKQTSTRVDEDLKEYVVNGETYVEFSSRKDNPTRNATAAYGAICDGTRNIICCANGKRMDDISKIVARVNASPILGGKFTFKVWLDEADKFTSFISKIFIPLAGECDNIHVYLLTATPDALFKKYKGVNVMPLDETVKPNYHGWKDNIIVELENPGSSSVDFIEEVLTTNIGLIQPGTKWYIPADVMKTTHTRVAGVCVLKKMAVFVVNGDGLTLHRPGMDPIIEEKTEELNKQIMRLYAKHELHAYAVAITGYICVGRGISIMSPDFIFNYGILSSCQKKAEASQSAGRLKGNIKNWENYNPPTVFCTKKFDIVATEWEEKSRRLALLAKEHQDAGGSTVVTKSEFKTLNEGYDYTIHPDYLSTPKEVRDFLAKPEIMHAMGLDKAPHPQIATKKNRMQCAGYAVTSKLLTKGQKASDLTKNERLTKARANEIAAGTCISTKKGSRFLILPVYDNLDTPPDQEQYQVRYLSIKH